MAAVAVADAIADEAFLGAVLDVAAGFVAAAMADLHQAAVVDLVADHRADHRADRGGGDLAVTATDLMADDAAGDAADDRAGLRVATAVVVAMVMAAAVAMVRAAHFLGNPFGLVHRHHVGHPRLVAGTALPLPGMGEGHDTRQGGCNEEGLDRFHFAVPRVCWRKPPWLPWLPD